MIIRDVFLNLKPESEECSTSRHVRLFPHHISQDVGVLDVIRDWVGHRIVVGIVTRVEVVAGVSDDLGTCNDPCFLSLRRTRLLQILTIFAHLHHLSVSLNSGHLTRRKRNLLVFLLQFTLLLTIVSTLHMFFIDFSV